MMMRTKLSVLGIISLALAGCATNLTLTKAVPLESDGTYAIQNGLPYDLYFDQFHGAVVYQLTDCHTLDLKVSAAVEEKKRFPDPEQRYYVDPNSLSSFAKTSEVNIEYHPSGMVKSINATAEDKSVEIIAGGLQAALGIAKMVAAPGAGDGSERANLCNENTAKALEAYNRQKGTVASRLTDHKTASEQFDRIKAKADKLAPYIDPDTARKYREAYDLLVLRTESLEAAQTKLKKLAEPISHKVRFALPENGSTFSGTISQFNSARFAAMMQRWVKPGQVPNPGLAERLTVTYAVSPVQGPTPKHPTLTNTDLTRGIPYRSARPGTLKIVQPKSVSTASDGTTKTEEKVLLSKQYPLLQLGRIGQLSCRSRALTSMGCSLAFDENGQLTKGGSKTTSTAGQGLAKVASDGVSQVAGFKAELDGRDQAALKARADELELRAKIAGLEDQLAGEQTPTQAFLEEKALLEAELGVIEARQKLEAAKSDSPLVGD